MMALSIFIGVFGARYHAASRADRLDAIYQRDVERACLRDVPGQMAANTIVAVHASGGYNDQQMVDYFGINFKEPLIESGGWRGWADCDPSESMGSNRIMAHRMTASALALHYAP